MAGEIFQWNLNGLKCKKSPNFKGKLEMIESILEKNTTTLIVNIQETHISKEEEIPGLFNTYKHLYNFEKTFANKDDPCSGILVCIRKTEEIVSTEEIVKGRLMHIKTRNKASNEIVNIFSIYCHSNISKKQK